MPVPGQSLTHSFIPGAGLKLLCTQFWRDHPSPSPALMQFCGEKVGHQCCLHSCKIVGHHLVISRLLLSHEETPVDVPLLSTVYYLVLGAHNRTIHWNSAPPFIQSQIVLMTPLHSLSRFFSHYKCMKCQSFHLRFYVDTEHIHHSYSRRRHNWSKFWISSGRKMGNLWKIIVTL